MKPCQQQGNILLPSIPAPRTPSSIGLRNVCKHLATMFAGTYATSQATLVRIFHRHPRVVFDVLDIQTFLHISIQHSLYQIYTLITVRVFQGRQS